MITKKQHDDIMHREKTMKTSEETFTVVIREVWAIEITGIKAHNSNEALEIANNRLKAGDTPDADYSYTLDKDKWWTVIKE